MNKLYRDCLYSGKREAGDWTSCRAEEVSQPWESWCTFCQYNHFIDINQAVEATLKENERLRKALREVCDVGREYYDMDMGPNGSLALDQADEALGITKETE